MPGYKSAVTLINFFRKFIPCALFCVLACTGPHEEGDGALVDEGCPDGGGDVLLAEPDPDVGSFSCEIAWASPLTGSIEPGSRPAPATFPAMRMYFEHVRLPEGGFIELLEIEGEQVVMPSDGPFFVETHMGAWVELRDADETVLYTRSVAELFRESADLLVAGTCDLERVEFCPDLGRIELSNVLNAPTAVEVAFFQEVIDGKRRGGPSVEVAVFSLLPEQKK